VSTSWFKSLVERFNGKNADPAAAARAAQLRAFRAAVARDLRGDPSPEDRAALEALLRVPEEQGLPGDEVELEMEALQGALDAIALKEAVAKSGLPVIEHQHRALGADRVHFLASAFLASDGSDRTGRLFLTNRRLVFVTTPMIALSWSGILSIEQQARDLVIATAGRDTLYQFRCNSFSDARCGAFIARQLKRGNTATAAVDPASTR
jgi:hypothetical protein